MAGSALEMASVLIRKGQPADSVSLPGHRQVPCGYAYVVGNDLSQPQALLNHCHSVGHGSIGCRGEGTAMLGYNGFLLGLHLHNVGKGPLLSS
jgi:hypothetical protein